jgi:5-(carboxyamino)imidazole ribonucleotide synthase
MVGAGQLARMSLAPAIALGVRLRLLAASARDAAALVDPDVVVGLPGDRDIMAAFAAGCDAVTFDHELVDLGLLAELEAAGHAIRPGPGALAFAVDKGHQRREFSKRGLPVPPWAPVASAADVEAFAAGPGGGWPVVLKATRGGYDGRGVWVIADAGEAAAVVDAARGGAGLIAESNVDIERELAVLVARRPGGQAVVWPLVETVQRDGICVELVLPARVEPRVEAEARELGLAVAEAVGAVGVMAVELFLDTAGRLSVNEVATRPHNSGHWTIEGARTSQFANHLRAVLDLPLGPTGLTGRAVVTVNVLGGPDGSDPGGRLAPALAEGVDVHLYGKAARPGRKLGHVTARGDDPADVAARARRAAAALTGP